MDATAVGVVPTVENYYNTKEELLENGIFPLKHLANELVTHILHQLSYRQLVAAERVCWSWKTISGGLCSKVTLLAFMTHLTKFEDLNDLCRVIENLAKID